MATEAQFKANQQNAQHSTGATSEAGAARSSQNSTKHGYTGRSLVLKPEEIEDYNEHVAAYIAEYEPFTQRQSQLVQQKADLDWSLQQISIEQFNTMTHMNVVSSQPPDPANPLAVAQQLAPYSKILNTFNLYETRRRRAAKALTEELEALIKSDIERRMKEINEAAKLYKAYKAKGQTFDPAEFGFVCSLQQILDSIKGTEARQMISGPPPTLEDEAITKHFLNLKAQEDAALAKILKAK
jgi:hypothetical protein